jgi:hypothetical protein
MGKTVKNLKAWAKKSFHAVKKDPSIIGKQMDKMQKRAENITRKGMDTYGKFQAGDYLGGIKGVHDTYRATVGGRKDDQMLKTNKGYRRATNIGTKTYKAAEAFQAGDHDKGYKHAIEAARAAIGKAKLREVQATKAGQHALAAQSAFLKAKAAHEKGMSGGHVAASGIKAYAEKRNNQTAPGRPLLGRRQ